MERSSLPQAAPRPIDRTGTKSWETRLGMGRGHKANGTDGWLTVHKAEEHPHRPLPGLRAGARGRTLSPAVAALCINLQTVHINSFIHLPTSRLRRSGRGRQCGPEGARGAARSAGGCWVCTGLAHQPRCLDNWEPAGDIRICMDEVTFSLSHS